MTPVRISASHDVQDQVPSVGMRLRCVLLALLSVAAQHAYAHHSAAAFDRAHPVLMKGTVEHFLWANPHTWLYMQVPNDHGSSDEWLLEGPPLSMLVRKGWNGKTLVAGQKLQLIVALYKDGSKRGEFTTVRDEAGREL